MHDELAGRCPDDTTKDVKILNSLYSVMQSCEVRHQIQMCCLVVCVCARVCVYMRACMRVHSAQHTECMSQTVGQILVNVCSSNCYDPSQHEANNNTKIPGQMGEGGLGRGRGAYLQAGMGRQMPGSCSSANKQSKTAHPTP